MSTAPEPTPPSVSPDPAPPYAGGKITNRQLLDALEYSPIGGGKGAPNTLQVKQEDADYVVRTATELARRAAEPGKIVYVPRGTSIDISSVTIELRATVASDRGTNGSEGALIYSNAKGTTSHAWNGGSGRGHIQMRGSGRLTGVRLRGFAYNYHNNPEHPGYIPFAPGDTAAKRAAWRNSRTARGINVHSLSARIDNCEIYGWSYSAINCGSTATVASPTVEFCHFHDNMMTSAGYACEVIRGRPHFRYCYFNAHRHALAGAGYSDCGFVVEDCVFGPSASSFQVDMHGLHNNLSANSTVADPNSTKYHGQAGGRIVIRRCEHWYTHVISDANFDQGRPCAAVSIRGIPSPRSGDGIVLDRNAYSHRSLGPNPAPGGRAIPVSVPHHQQTRGGGDQPFNYPSGSNGFAANFRQLDNVANIQQSKPPADRGAPIDVRNPPTEADLPTGAIAAPIGETYNADPWAQDPDPTRRIAVARGGRKLVNELEALSSHATEPTPGSQDTESASDDNGDGDGAGDSGTDPTEGQAP